MTVSADGVLILASLRLSFSLGSLPMIYLVCVFKGSSFLRAAFDRCVWIDGRGKMRRDQSD